MSVVESLIEAGLWIDSMLYGLISKIYSLIITLAQYHIFDSDTIGEISRRVYALTGIFMLFKITFSMIVYLVNPDEFSDKSKGFGSLIKNVIISMVLIIAVPYIFTEAYYVQKMILVDGTLTKIVLSDSGDASDISLATAAPGDKIQYILFTQFIRPNYDVHDDEYDLEVCKKLYEYDENGKRKKDEARYFFNEECFEALDHFYKKADKDATHATLYRTAIEYQELGILLNSKELYSQKVRQTAKGGEPYETRVISYRWPVSTIVGAIVVLMLITLCLDVAVRSIKLGFYQIVAPIPILSNCDPKAGKNGMLQKWAKACLDTYLDLFIRLLGLFLGILLIIKLTEDNTFQGFASVILIIGALMFAKQLPKILQDITGLKLDGKFTLNPFKKMANELPDGLGKFVGGVPKRVTGAAGGFLAGMIGGGRGVGDRLFSGALGTVRGAVIGKGFAKGLNAQADVNRKIRDARINGATFLGGVGAAAASTFGLDGAELERRATILRRNQDNIDTVRRGVDAQNKVLETQKKGIERRIAPRKNVMSKQKEAIDSMKALQDDAVSLIKGDKAGEHFKRWHHFYQGQDKYVAALNELESLDGVTLNQAIRSADGKHVYAAGTKVTKDMLEKVGFDNTGYYENKVGRDELLQDLNGPLNTDGTTAKGVGADKVAHHQQLDENAKLAIDNYNNARDEYQNEVYAGLTAAEQKEFDDAFITIDISSKESAKAAGGAKNAFADALSDQIADSENSNMAINRTMSADNIEIEGLERQMKANVTDATVRYYNFGTHRMEEGTLEEAENEQKERKDELERRKKEWEQNNNMAQNQRKHIFPE